MASPAKKPKSLGSSKLRKYEAKLHMINGQNGPFSEETTPSWATFQKPSSSLKSNNLQSKTMANFSQIMNQQDTLEPKEKDTGLLWIRKKTMSEVPNSFMSRNSDFSKSARIDAPNSSVTQVKRANSREKEKEFHFVKKVKKALGNVDFINEELFEKEKMISVFLQEDLRKSNSGALEAFKTAPLNKRASLPRNISFLGDPKKNFIKSVQKGCFEKRKEQPIQAKMFDYVSTSSSPMTDSILDMVDLSRLKERITQISVSGEKIRGEFIIPEWLLDELPSNKIKSLKEYSLDPILGITKHIKGLDTRRSTNGLNSRCQTERFAVWLVQVVDFIRKKDYKTIQEYFGDFQTIFTLSMRELFEQIKTEVKERGELLELIWDSYIRTFSFLFETIRKEWFGIEKEYLRSEKQIHQIYESDREQLKKTISELTLQVQEEKQNVHNLKRQLLYLDKKKKSLELEYLHSKRESKLLRDELTISHNDNIKLMVALTQKLVSASGKSQEGETTNQNMRKMSLRGSEAKGADQESINKLIQSIKVIENNQRLINLIHTNNKMSYQDMMTKMLSIEDNYTKYDSNTVCELATDTQELEAIALMERLSRLVERGTVTDNQEVSEKGVQVASETEVKGTMAILRQTYSYEENDDDDLVEFMDPQPESKKNEQKAKTLTREFDTLVMDSKKIQVQSSLKSMSSIIFEDVMNKSPVTLNEESHPVQIDKFHSEIKKLAEKFESVSDKLRAENDRLRIEVYEKELEKMQLEEELAENERILEEAINQANTSLTDIEKSEPSPRRERSESIKSKFYSQRESILKELPSRERNNSKDKKGEKNKEILKGISEEAPTPKKPQIQKEPNEFSDDVAENEPFKRESPFAKERKEVSPEARTNEKPREKLVGFKNLNIQRALKNTKVKIKITHAFAHARKNENSKSPMTPEVLSPLKLGRKDSVSATASNSKHVARLYESTMPNGTGKLGENGGVKGVSEKKSGRVLSKSSILKVISQVYSEVTKTKAFGDFRTTVYENGLNLFGLQKMADERFIQVLDTCRFYKLRDKRISVFGRFLHLYNPLFDSALAFFSSCMAAVDADGNSEVESLQTKSKQRKILYSFLQLLPLNEVAEAVIQWDPAIKVALDFFREKKPKTTLNKENEAILTVFEALDFLNEGRVAWELCKLAIVSFHPSILPRNPDYLDKLLRKHIDTDSDSKIPLTFKTDC